MGMGQFAAFTGTQNGAFGNRNLPCPAMLGDPLYRAPIGIARLEIHARIAACRISLQRALNMADRVEHVGPGDIGDNAQIGD